MSAISQAIMARPVASAVRRVDAAATIGAPFRAAAAPLMLARAAVPRGLGRGALMVTRAKVESHNEMHPGALERDTSKYTYYEVKVRPSFVIQRAHAPPACAREPSPQNPSRYSMPRRVPVLLGWGAGQISSPPRAYRWSNILRHDHPVRIGWVWGRW